MTPKVSRQPRRQALLLEKNRGLALVLELILRQAGYQVNICATETDLLAQMEPGRLRLDPVALVLADLADGGPGQDNLLARLRFVARLLPVIAIAPYGQEKSGARLGKLPGCQVLTSPLDPEELQSCLAQVSGKAYPRTDQPSHNG
jgi:CheY-like chemotaxis protein